LNGCDLTAHQTNMAWIHWKSSKLHCGLLGTKGRGQRKWKHFAPPHLVWADNVLYKQGWQLLNMDPTNLFQAFWSQFCPGSHFDLIHNSDPILKESLINNLLVIINPNKRSWTRLKYCLITSINTFQTYPINLQQWDIYDWEVYLKDNIKPGHWDSCEHNFITSDASWYQADRAGVGLVSNRGYQDYYKIYGANDSGITEAMGVLIATCIAKASGSHKTFISNSKFGLSKISPTIWITEL